MVAEDAASGRVDEHGSRPPRSPRQRGMKRNEGMLRVDKSEVVSHTFRWYAACSFTFRTQKNTGGCGREETEL